MGKTPWRLIEEGKGDGSVNMITDKAILLACHEGKVPPTLRLYGWNRPTLSLGYLQNVTLQVNTELCQTLNIPIVKRPTGGRAILHNDELTYSVIAPTSHPSFFGGLRQTFEVISTALLKSLSQLEIHEVCLKRDGRYGDKRLEVKSPACFASFNLFEIAVKNRKLIGSAQRRTKNAFLQHGSILIDMDRELLNSLLLFDDIEKGRSHLEYLSNKTITLNEVCERTVKFEEVEKAFREGFSETFLEGFSLGGLTKFESELQKKMLTKTG